MASATHTESAPPNPAGAPPSPWLPGTEFSKYEIDSRLAAGGMAEVWRAKIKGAQGFQKRIVIKTMLTSLQSRPELVQMFISEAAVAAQLGHANIVHVFDFGQLEGRYFIAMEYVPGVTLRVAHKRMVARGERLPVPTVLHVMMDVCDALEHVHAAADAGGTLGLVHRDISPDNVIISTSGSAKLIDFGAARATARTPPTPVFVGKYRYAAPERIRRVGEDPRSDVYSAGVILYECLAGKRPFEGTDAAVIQAVLAARGCDPRARVPDLPASLAAVVLKATAPDPADRYPSARKLRQALSECLEEVGGTNKERDVTAALADLLETPAAAPRAPRSRRRRTPRRCPSRSAWSATASRRTARCDWRCARWRSSTRRARFESWPSRRPRRACERAAAAAARSRARRPPSRPRRLRRSRRSRSFRVDRTRWNGRRASARSRCSTAASRSAAAGVTAKRSTPGRRRSRSRPTTASTRRTCSGCAAISVGCGPRRRPSTSPARCASSARRWGPTRRSASTACFAWSPSTR